MIHSARYWADESGGSRQCRKWSTTCRQYICCFREWENSWGTSLNKGNNDIN